MMPLSVFLPALAGAALVLLLPGLAGVLWLPTARRDALEVLADAAGWSVALLALLALLFFELGVKFGAVVVVTLLYLSLALIFFGWRRGWRGLPGWRDAGLWLGLFFGLLLIAWRWIQARDLLLPAWVDSVHHTLVVQKILETGGLPGDLGAQLPAPFFYHYAFHVLAAGFAALTRAEPASAVLWLGQVISAGVSFGVYRLGRALWPGRWRAAVAALLVGFVSQYPAYYVSWGRYTLALGVMMLALGLAAALDLSRADDPYNQVDNPVRRARQATLAALTAGTLLSHYLAGGLLLIFLAGLALTRLPRALREHRRTDLLTWAAPAAGGLLLAAPWLARVILYGGRLAGFSAGGVSGNPLDALKSTLALLGPERSYAILILAGVGLGLALVRGGARWFAAWALLLCLLALPFGPRVAPFRPDQVALVLFLPAGLLAAHSLVSGAERLARRLNLRAGLLRAALAVVTALWLVWGLGETGNMVNPRTGLADSADVQALRWAVQNTPPDARFFINVVQWQPGSYRGVDGGYWLLPLTGRAAFLPPVVYGWGGVEDIRQVNQWAARAARATTCNLDFWQLVVDARLTHVYLREGRGEFQPAAAAACPRLRPIYSQGGVWIYAIQ